MEGEHAKVVQDVDDTKAEDEEADEQRRDTKTCVKGELEEAVNDDVEATEGDDVHRYLADEAVERAKPGTLPDEREEAETEDKETDEETDPMTNAMHLHTSFGNYDKECLKMLCCF